MIIKITSAFERTRQIADFVPIKAYCEATIEEDGLPPIEALDDKAKKDLIALQGEMSQALDFFVQQEVDLTLKNYNPMCIVCGGKGQKVSLNKEGVCGQCVSDLSFRARDLRKELGNVDRPNDGARGETGIPTE